MEVKTNEKNVCLLFGFVLSNLTFCMGYLDNFYELLKKLLAFLCVKLVVNQTFTSYYLIDFRRFNV